MPLTKVDLAPGFNKQVTQTGAEGRWTDGDFVRFRYGLPEKIGGWEQILESTLIGAAREQFVWAWDLVVIAILFFFFDIWGLFSTPWN